MESNEVLEMDREIELKDAFGHSYYERLIPREKVVEILKDLDVEEVVKKAYRAYCPSFARGICFLDLRYGNLVDGTYTSGCGDIQGAHLIPLFSVPQNLDIPDDHLYNEEEFCERNTLEEEEERPISMREYAEIADIDLDMRILEAVLDGAYYEIFSQDWWEEVNEHLDEIY
jgi:hypothetical protein